MVECVAEFTTNHLGNMTLLHRMVEAAATAGATSIKMQKKDVETFYTQEKLCSPFDSPYGKTYRDYRTTFEMSKNDWLGFDQMCRAHKIPWFATAQDIPSLQFFTQAFANLGRYKIASSNARNWEFLAEASRQIPRECEVVLSIAGSTLSQIDKALGYFRDHDRVYLLHCVAEYPCLPDRLRLGNITMLKQEFETARIRIGYSGHETGIAGSLAAATLGVEMIERHFCLSRQSFAHHIACSLEPDEFAHMVDTVSNPKGSGGSKLPEEAMACHFGMTGGEASFLEHQTYGTEKLGRRSHF